MEGGTVVTALMLPQDLRPKAVRRSRGAIVGAVIAAVLASALPWASAASGAADPHADDASESAERRARVRLVPVATGLAGPSAFTFGPRSRIWYLERGTGRVRVLNLETGGERTFFTITRVDGAGERGALGIALDPDFPARPFVYVYATRRDNGQLWNQVLRIRSVDGEGGPTKLLLRSPVGVATNHNGGRILIGPDEKLWVVDGDNANPRNAQDRSRNLRGKMLRINLDGSVPATNPFRSPIYSYGHRNSFGFTFDPETGALWQTENGPDCNDEINRIVKGGNFAWGPDWRCPSTPTVADTNRDGPRPRRLPRFRFVNPIGITGAAFCDRCRLGGARNGDLLFGAVNDGRVRALNLNRSRTDVVGPVRVLVTAPDGIHSMEVGPSGRIYVSTRDAIYRLATR
jgi:glucose/arabinose dehydrogenase